MFFSFLLFQHQVDPNFNSCSIKNWKSILRGKEHKTEKSAITKIYGQVGKTIQMNPNILPPHLNLNLGKNEEEGEEKEEGEEQRRRRRR